jgi:hypothetical protein
VVARHKVYTSGGNSGSGDLRVDADAQDGRPGTRARSRYRGGVDGLVGSRLIVH